MGNRRARLRTGGRRLRHVLLRHHPLFLLCLLFNVTTPVAAIGGAAVDVHAAARYEHTGEARARAATEAFWRELQSGYSYVSGGSSFQEEWREPHSVEGTLQHRGAANWAAHDHQESCVTHNSMSLSARLLSWDTMGDDGRLAHAECTAPCASSP